MRGEDRGGGLPHRCERGEIEPYGLERRTRVLGQDPCASLLGLARSLDAITTSAPLPRALS
jgi:hypothetical protein